jgi:hypothetical protein
MRLSIALLLVTMTLGVRAETADIVFTNGSIYTVNDVQPWAEAVAVKDKRIHFVGAERDVGHSLARQPKSSICKAGWPCPGFMMRTST